MERARGTDRLLDVLDCVIDLQRPVTRNAIADVIGAPRSTIYSIVEQLLKRGFLEQATPDGPVVPGAKCGLLGFAYDRHNPFGRKARQLVSNLARSAGEVAELDIMRGWKQIVLISETGRDHNYRVATEGSSSALPRTASGRFLLQGFASGELETNIVLADFVMSDGSKISPRELTNEVDRAELQGYWVAKGLIDPYIGCVTAPVYDRTHRCIAAVCLVVPLPELAQREDEFVTLVRNAGQELTRLSRSSNGSIDQI